MWLLCGTRSENNTNKFSLWQCPRDSDPVLVSLMVVHCIILNMTPSAYVLPDLLASLIQFFAGCFFLILPSQSYGWNSYYKSKTSLWWLSSGWSREDVVKNNILIQLLKPLMFQVLPWIQASKEQDVAFPLHLVWKSRSSSWHYRFA